MGLFDWLAKKPGEGLTGEGEHGPLTQVASGVPLTEGPDRFIDKGQLAKGGMGAIRRVFNRNLLRHEAMKVLDPQVAAEPDEVLRFLEEAQIAGQLDHPNIPAVHEVGLTARGEHYFTMKLVRGQTLEEMLTDPGFSLAREEHLFEVLQILTRVCDAIAFAHSRGVIHCDLKPANVMVGAFGQVFVMDWGISRLKGGRRQSRTELEIPASGPSARGPASGPGPAGMPRRMTMEGEIRTVGRDRSSDDGKVIGTLSYMAPEQARGQVDLIDERTDIFAIGGLLYRILTGRAPHMGKSTEESYHLARRCEVMDPQKAAELTESGAHLPARLCRIAMKALHPDRAKRYASVAELQRELEEFLQGGGRYPTQDFEAGTLIMRQGEPGDNAYVIVKGKVRVFRTDAGATKTVRLLGPGEVVGETALITDHPRNANVEAVEPVTAVVIARDALDRELGRTFWVNHILRAVVDRFRDLDAKLQVSENAMEARLREAAIRQMAFQGQPRADGARSMSWLALRRYLRDALNLGDLEVVALAAGIRGLTVRAETDEVILAPDPAPPRRPSSASLRKVTPTAPEPRDAQPSTAATLIEMPAAPEPAASSPFDPPPPSSGGPSPFDPPSSAPGAGPFARTMEVPTVTDGPEPASSPFEPPPARR